LQAKGKRIFMLKRLCFAIGTLLISTLILSAPSTGDAKVFKNTYISFEYPDGWDCHLENTEWVCKATSDKESKEAIIVLTAKEAGPIDNDQAYLTHLSKPQTPIYKGKQGALSKVIYPPKKVSINDQPWIDGLHGSSEVPNYFTRYLATIKDKIAILFTCTAHKDYYTKYNMAFFKAVQSLRVIASKNLLDNQGVRSSGGNLGDPIGPTIGNNLPLQEEEQPVVQNPNANAGGSSTKSMFIGIAVLLAALGIYIFLKSKK
jgi:hypothetical protein